METNPTDQQDTGQTKDSPKKRPKRVDCLPPSKDCWRRVFNNHLKCYEIYVRGGNFLVATGIHSEQDSYIIGMVPPLVDLIEQLLEQIQNGEVKETTFRGIKYILSAHNKTYRKAKRVGGVGVQRHDSPEPHMGGKGGRNNP